MEKMSILEYFKDVDAQIEDMPSWRGEGVVVKGKFNRTTHYSISIYSIESQQHAVHVRLEIRSGLKGTNVITESSYVISRPEISIRYGPFAPILLFQSSLGSHIEMLWRPGLSRCWISGN